VKAALLLSLFGGGQAQKDAMLPRRDDINVLMVGDPAMGKSQLLKAVSEIAPRCKCETLLSVVLYFRFHTCHMFIFSRLRLWNWKYRRRINGDFSEGRGGICC